MIGELFVKIGADFKDLEKGIETASKKLEKFSKKITEVGKDLTFGLTVPIAALAGSSIKLAADFEETLNKINVSFGDNAKEIVNWSKTSIKRMGLAQASALEAAALFGDFATGMGLTEDEASDMSMNLTQLGADLSSFKNIPVEQAMSALKGVFTGETESLKGLGVVMTQTNLETFGLSQGIQKNIADMTEAEKINLRYAFVMNASKNAQGDFSRTSQGASNQMKILKETLIELGTQFGTVMLPIFTKIINKVNEFVSSFMNLNKETQKIILIVAGVVAGIGPLLLIIGQLIKVFSILSSPIGIIVLAIAGITAAILYLYKTNKTFANFVLNAWEKIKTAFQFVGDIIKSVIEGDISKAIGQFEDLLFGVTMISEEKIMAIGDFLHRLKNVFIEIFEFIKVIIEENFIPVFEKIFEVVETVFNSVKETITAILPEVLEFIKNILGSILLFWETHGEKIMTFVSFYFNVIRNIFVFVLNVLKTTVTFVFDFIRIYIVTALQVIAKFVQFWVAIFTGDWSGAFEKIKEIFAIIWDAVKQILVVVLEFLKNLFLDFAEYLKSQWELIRESVISIVNKIKDKIIEIWTNISNFLTETFENIKTKTLELWNSIEKYVILIAGIITGLFIPKLVMLGISATVNAAKVVAAWVVMAVQATTSAIITTVTAIPSIIAGFIRMAIASTINALKVVASWVMTSVAAVANVAIMVTQSAVMVAKWVMMGTQSLIQAARMAAAWIIAMGPIAWITAAIIGFALLIIMNWEKIKEMTIKIYTAISDKIKEIWKSIIESIKTVINNIVTFIRDKFNSIRDTLFGIMGAIGSKIKETFNNIVTDIKNSINKVIDLVNGVISKFNGIRINIPKVEIPEVKILGFETPAFSVGGQSFGVPQIPSIPRLAEGGIINKPTLAMIGEGGESEAVIPLSKLAGLSGNNQTHIYLDGKEITRAVAPQMVDMLRAKLAY